MGTLRHWLQLALTEGIGPILSRRLIDTAGGDVEAACAADAGLLRRVDGIGTSKAHKIRAALGAAAAQVDDELARAERAGGRVICPGDAEYPALLHHIPDPPNVLYVRGTFEPRDLHALAIVGSRRCSHYGREQAERFGAALANIGMTVVSGGARGIDSHAHRGALSHPKGRTIAVLGSGVDVAYPSENADLFEQIAASGRGAVVSEYPMGTPPNKENFPRRNRIVSGMSRGVLVVEADERSGALITARQACEDHGRPVFAMPGRVDNPMSQGPHKLIREGAVLVERIGDIVENLGPVPAGAGEPLLFDGMNLDAATSTTSAQPNPQPAAAPVPLSEHQERILTQLGPDPAAVDRIIERSGLDASVVLRELTFLSLKGVVKRVDGQTYVRRA